MVHRNARLTPLTRLDLVRAVEQGLSQAEAARQFRVCRATVAKWMRRFRQEGEGGLEDRSCRPFQSPRLTPPSLVVSICHLRQEKGWGPHRIGWALGTARSTVYAVLRRQGMHRLAWLHRVTRQIVRYERSRPGELMHLDVKKLGRVPEGGGKRFAPGFDQTHSGPSRGRSLGVDYLHVAVDDFSRYAYVESLPNERAVTTVAFLSRALRHFRRQQIKVERILTDNGSNYRSRLFQEHAAARGIRLKRTRPYRPQTNGKAEAFNKILQAEWAYSRPYTNNPERLDDLSRFLTYYNHERPHGGIGGAVPASRL
jgi:transposase InsO family protein